MMRSLRVSAARTDAAVWLIAASGGVLPRMALGRRTRLVLPVGSFHPRRLIWVSRVMGARRARYGLP